MILVEPGEVFPISLNLESRTPGLFPRAYLRDETGAAVSGPYALGPMAGFSGRYITTGVAPVTPGQYVLVFDTYTDAGFTLLSSPDGPAEDTLVVAGISNIAGSVWDQAVSAHNLAGSFGLYVRVAAQIAGKSNYRIDNMIYDVNGFLTVCRIRNFPSAVVASASTPGGIGEGELDIITLAGLPDGTFFVLPTTILGLR